MAIHAAAGLGLGGTNSIPVFEPFGLIAPGSQIVGGYTRPTEAPGIRLEVIGPLDAVLHRAAASSS